MGFASQARLCFAVGLPLALLTLAACRASQPAYPIMPTDELVRQGQAIYATYCVTCHGDETGQNRQFDAPPHNEAGHTWHHPDRLLVEWVLDGPPLRTAMPAFRGSLNEEEARAVIAYIKTFWPEDIRQSQTTFSQVYEEQLKEQQR